MATAGDVVREFCVAIDRKDMAKVESLLDEKVVYHNIGSEPAVGREAAVAAVQFQFDMFDPIVFRIRNLAEDGDTVLDGAGGRDHGQRCHGSGAGHGHVRGRRRADRAVAGLLRHGTDRQAHGRRRRRLAVAGLDRPGVSLTGRGDGPSIPDGEGPPERRQAP